MELKNIDLEQFHDMVINTFADDPLQVIIKGHLILESKLITLIELCLINKQEIDIARLRFPVKVDLAYALGAIKQKGYKKIFMNINSLRNKFAHNINYEFIDEDFVKMFDGNSNVEIFFRELFHEKDYLYKIKILFLLLYTALELEEEQINNE